MGKIKDWFLQDVSVKEFTGAIKETKENISEAKKEYTRARGDYLKKAAPAPDNTFRSTSHFFHLICTLLSGGLWIPIWVYCSLSNTQHNRKVEHNR